MVSLCHLHAVMDDIVKYDQTLALSLELDKKRVQKLVDTRGISVVMIDFPDACKVLDASLSSEFLCPSLLPKTFGRRRLDSEKWLFGSIFLKLFNEFGTLVENPDITLIFFLRQLLLLYKKVKLPCPQENVDKAVREFFIIEESMRSPSLLWNSESLTWRGIKCNYFGEPLEHSDDEWSLPLFSDSPKLRRMSFCEQDDSAYPIPTDNREVPRPLKRLMDRVSKLVISRFPELNPEDVVPQHGPGAVADCKGDKYTFPNWPKKLGLVFSADIFASYNWLESMAILGTSREHEPPAKLIAVPKTLKSPRLIASEPTSHQFLQQGLLRWIRSNLPFPLRLCIDFSSQQPSQDDALKASYTGEVSSIDLSSASDRLSCWAVERVFQYAPTLMEGLHAVRTRTVEDKASSTPGKLILLKKYANQGSAVTFPLQSIVYAIAAISSVLYEDGKFNANTRDIINASKKVRVYGDDLLVPVKASVSLMLLLTHLGLKVNMQKTHVQGHFRESCGVDALAGWDISPVYLSNLDIGRGFESLSSWVEVSNNAYRKGLWSLSDLMRNQIPERRRKLIPVLHWPQSHGPAHYTYQNLTNNSSMRGRWNSSLQRPELLIITSKVRQAKGDRTGSQGIYQYFIDRPEPDSNWSQGYLVNTRVLICTRWSPA